MDAVACFYTLIFAPVTLGPETKRHGRAPQDCEKLQFGAPPTKGAQNAGRIEGRREKRGRNRRGAKARRETCETDTETRPETGPENSSETCSETRSETDPEGDAEAGAESRAENRRETGGQKTCKRAFRRSRSAEGRIARRDRRAGKSDRDARPGRRQTFRL